MNIVLSLVNRNLKVFLRNKAAVFFSFLSVIIILALYALFLGDVQIANIKQQLGKDVDGMGWLVNSWILAGLLCVNTITISLGSIGNMVDDFHTGAAKDFMAAPIGRTHLVIGYLISTWIITLLLSIISFVIIEVYIVIQGGELLTLKNCILVILIMSLSIISFSAVLFYIASFIKTPNAFGTFSTILGTLIGFLAGIYIPIGVLPDAVQKVVTLFPISYVASMLRQVLIEQPSAIVFDGAPSEVIDGYNKLNGVTLSIGSYELSWTFMIISLIVIAILFYFLSVIRLIKNKR